MCVCVGGGGGVKLYCLVQNMHITFLGEVIHNFHEYCDITQPLGVLLHAHFIIFAHIFTGATMCLVSPFPVLSLHYMHRHLQQDTTYKTNISLCVWAFTMTYASLSLPLEFVTLMQQHNHHRVDHLSNGLLSAL